MLDTPHGVRPSHPRPRSSRTPLRRLREPDAVPGAGHPAGLQPLRLVHPARRRPPERAADRRVARAQPAAGSRHHARLQRRRSAGAGALAAALQPDRHQPASRRHERRPTGARGEGRRARCAGGGAGLRLSRGQEFHRAQSAHRHRAHLPVAGQCAHPDLDRQVHRRQAQRPARHRGDGRAGDAGGGRQHLAITRRSCR